MSSININNSNKSIQARLREENAVPLKGKEASATITKTTRVIEHNKLDHSSVLPLERDLAETWELFNTASKRQHPSDTEAADAAIKLLNTFRNTYRKTAPNTELHYISSEGRIVLVSRGPEQKSS